MYGRSHSSQKIRQQWAHNSFQFRGDTNQTQIRQLQAPQPLGLIRLQKNLKMNLPSTFMNDVVSYIHTIIHVFQPNI